MTETKPFYIEDGWYSRGKLGLRSSVFCLHSLVYITKLKSLGREVNGEYKVICAKCDRTFIYSGNFLVDKWSASGYKKATFIVL